MKRSCTVGILEQVLDLHLDCPVVEAIEDDLLVLLVTDQRQELLAHHEVDALVIGVRKYRSNGLARQGCSRHLLELVGEVLQALVHDSVIVEVLDGSKKFEASVDNFSRANLVCAKLTSKMLFTSLVFQKIWLRYEVGTMDKQVRTMSSNQVLEN